MSRLVIGLVSALVKAVGYNVAVAVAFALQARRMQRAANGRIIARYWTMQQPPKVLIVDSDPQMTEVLGLSLSYSEQTYEVASATSASKALLQLGIVLPDLIILEVTMPAGEGWDVLRRIREISTVPVIAVVDREDPELCIKSLESGADSCLVKPVSLLELGARVQALLRRQKKLDSADWLPWRLAA